MSGDRKGKFRSFLHPLSCFSSHKDDRHEQIGQIGQRGYSRVVYCNDPDNPEAIRLNYKGNYVSTTRYTAWNFFPKSLFEQFRRVANFYFLVVACVSFTPLAPFKAVSIIAPLVLVIGVTMLKEAVEDWRRLKQDLEANNRTVEVFDKYRGFYKTRWKSIRVGDIVKVYRDNYFPADLLLLSSSYDDGICYVETMNLDGETNLKVKQCLEITASIKDEESLKKFRAIIKCEDPNDKLYTFVGRLYENEKEHPLSLWQLLLRDSKLKNTDYVFGVAVFTGHDTKVMQNATDPRSKRSKIEKKMDKLIYFLFCLLISISFLGSIYFGIKTKEDLSGGRYERWYLRPDDATVFFDPRRAVLAAFFHFLTDLMLYGYFIPISLYVSIEIVKVLQSIFINQDRAMYHGETNRPAQARTSNLNEELGQVDLILSDKTGTLTCNSMEFVKCSIAGIAYGYGETEVERALARRNEPPEASEISNDVPGHDSGAASVQRIVKGFNFRDDRIMNGRWTHDKATAKMIETFVRALAICHTVVPDLNKASGEVNYEAESPDEAAFVIAARELGFEFTRRTETRIELLEMDCDGRKVHRTYQLLHVLEFTNARKRMSVVVRSEENKLLLFCKGADSVMFERLSEDGRRFEANTKDHIKKFSQIGLRVMVFAYRELGQKEYSQWEKKFLEAKNSVSANRDNLLDAAMDEIERELNLLGATGVEDKLQDGVPECIEKLARAGIELWVLTGDKLETAVNIGYACRLLREQMTRIEITLESPDIAALEKQGDKKAISEKSFERVQQQLVAGKSQLAKEGAGEFGLIIDGKSLDYALKSELEQKFLDVAYKCASVICCRSSPKQKALVTRLIKSKKHTGGAILSIGDGANDVSMLQEADIGVGISGVEGMEAVMASDFAIAQFCFLERLLLVHGHWCYRRIAMMICYFFYKNITFGFTLFWFEAYASFSGQPAYNDWYMSLYNVFFTSLPVIALGVFDQDVSAELCLEHPFLYQEGTKNILFNWSRIIGWMLNGVGCSIIIFFCTTNAIINQAFRKDGQVADYEILGVVMYTCVVWTVNCQMALSINYFTWIQHVFIWGSIAFWYIFLMVYGYLSPTFSTTAYMVLIEGCIPSILYWLTTLLVVISALLPYFSYRAFQSRFQPMPHDKIQRNMLAPSEAETCSNLRVDTKDKEKHVKDNSIPSSVEIE